jgi:MPBQ/MSBQ methyltransferase
LAESAAPALSLGDLSAPVLKSHGSGNEVAQCSANLFAAHPSNPNRPFQQGVAPQFVAAAVVCAAGVVVKHLLDTPSRAYVTGPDGASVGTVGEEYDAWTEEGILEYYWGEHIHLGYYTDEDMAKGAGTLVGCNVKDFIEAKFDFVDKMLEWSECPPEPARVLDVGCGIGGTSRHLAKRLGPKSQVQGITLSPNQRDRATALAKEQGVDNASFQVMNALAMDFEDDTFDLVWACESGEHMPDKKKYVEEMIRVLKPGGTIVIATWCQRETPPAFTAEEEANLKFLYEEWAHPYFVSIEEYVRLMEGTESMATVGSANWVKETIRSWRHSIWVGVYDPWPVIKAGPRIWWKTIREIVTLERMHRAFDCDLMTYGMMKGKKKAAPSPEKAP